MSDNAPPTRWRGSRLRYQTRPLRPYERVARKIDKRSLVVGQAISLTITGDNLPGLESPSTVHGVIGSVSPRDLRFDFSTGQVWIPTSSVAGVVENVEQLPAYGPDAGKLRIFGRTARLKANYKLKTAADREVVARSIALVAPKEKT